MSYKTFADGTIFAAADAQLLMDQSIIILPTKTALNTIPTPDPGQVVFIEDLDVYLRRVAGAWRCLTDFVIVANSIIRDQLPAPHIGLTVRSRDTGQEDRWDGTAWVPWTTAWQALVLQNGWVTFGGPYTTPQFRKLAGVLHVRALVKNGATASGTVIAQLPAGYRPNAQFMVGTAASSPAVPAWFDVKPNGEIVVGIGVSASFTPIQFCCPAEA